MSNRVPTVNDLRVKLCYICREEERYGDAQDTPPRAWTHPCNCTLVAHETCLLDWIKAAQQNPDRAPNALKCPQCGAKYELESKNTITLKVLNAWNKALSRTGRVVTISCAGVIVISLGAGLYAVLTSYGAWAVQNFIGKEMYNTILSDDPSNWPWHAFLNLPFVPLSLVLSRTPLLTVISPLFPLLFPWPADLPWSVRRSPYADARIRASYFLRPPGADPGPWWPPTPTLVVATFPFVRAFYRKMLDMAHSWVMGERIDRGNFRRFLLNINEPEFLRIRIGIEDDPEQAENGQQRRRGQQQQEAVDQPQGEEAAAADEDPDAELNPNLADADANAGPEGARINAGEAAERTINLTGSSLGRLVGGALIMPTVANLMGRLLLRLSRSPYMTILSRILAARPPRTTKLPSFWGSHQIQDGFDGGGFKSLTEAGTFMLRFTASVFGGTRIWAESDPVWWRNTLGLGLFIVAKDALKLLHLWLAKQEVESRHVKNRSFAGVDPKELDLIDPPP